MKIWYFIVCFLFGLSMYGQNTDTISNLNPFNRLEIKTSMLKYEYIEKRNGIDLKRYDVNYYPTIDGTMHEEGFNYGLSKKYLYSCPQAFAKAMEAINTDRKARSIGKKYSFIGLGTMITGLGLGAYLLSKEKSSGAAIFGAGFLGGGVILYMGKFKKQSIRNKAPSDIDIVNEYNKFCYLQSIDSTSLQTKIDSNNITRNLDMEVAHRNTDAIPNNPNELPKENSGSNIVIPRVEIKENDLAQNSIKNLNKTSFFGAAITPLDMTVASRIFAMSITVEPFYSYKGYELLFSYSNRIGRDSLSKNHKASLNTSIPLFTMGNEGDEILKLDEKFDGMSLETKRKLNKLKKINLNLGVDYMDQRIENRPNDDSYSIEGTNGNVLNNPILNMKSTNVRIGLSRLDFNSYDLKATFNKKENRFRKTYVFKYYLDFLYNVQANYTYLDQPLGPLDFNKYGLVGGVKYYDIRSIGGYYFNLELGRLPRLTIFDYDYVLLKFGFTLGGVKRKQQL